MYIREKGINDNQVTVNAHLSVGQLYNTRKNGYDLGKRTVEKILTYYQDLDRVWLLTGEGEMIKSKPSTSNKKSMIDPDYIIPLFSPVGVQKIESIILNEVDPVDYLAIPGITNADGAIYIPLDPIARKMKKSTGDILVYKRTKPSLDNISFGQLYLLTYNEESESRTTLAYVNQSETTDRIKLQSYGGFYESKVISLKSVVVMVQVMASIIYNID